MYAIVDCNSFYCSCERVFRPDLHEKPVVVLSNNDGCIISRSDEAKTLGVEMAGPYFKARPLIEKYGVATFSSNYNLYGDLSWRVMETLREVIGTHNVEVYSVDEAFLNLEDVPVEDLQNAAMHIKETVEQWTGVEVSIGVAPTKVLSKIANHIAKKNKKATGCVTVLASIEKINEALQKTMVDGVWGVGRQYAMKLHNWEIHSAYDLKNMSPQWAHKNLGGVVGARLIKELNGEPAIDMEEELVVKKMIATTRMFGAPVSTLHEIKEAVATYITRAAEKLRRQKSAASVVNVFVVPKEERKTDERFRHGPTINACAVLPRASALTNELIKPAMQLVESIFKNDCQYKKAGIILSGLVADDSLQGNLFIPQMQNNSRMLMSMMDNINFSMRDDVLKFAASGTERNWKMRQEWRSPRYTSRWDELCEVR
jgi:DNA polymerase V